MNKTVRNLLDAAWYLVIYFVIQVAVTIVLGSVFGMKPTDPLPAIISSATSGVLTLSLFMWRRWTPSGRSYLRTRPFATLVWAALAAVGTSVPVMLLSDMLGIRMPQDYMQLFSGVMNHELGYFVIGIFAPVVEEAVFRGAILRKLLSALGSRSRWLAVFISAALFGLCHGNAAQFLSAFVLGILLGWMYLRTRSIVPGIMFHWANNTLAFVVFRLMPGTADMKLIEFCGGSYSKLAILVVSSLCVLIPSLYQLDRNLRPAAKRQTQS